MEGIRPQIRSVLAVSTTLLAVGAVLANPTALAGQDNFCEDWSHSNDRERSCETREYTVAATAELDIDGGTNGGVEVVGTNRSDVYVTAEIWATADSEERAREIVDEVSISTSGNRLRADGPSRRWNDESWGVNWVVEVPVQTDLDIDTHNGGISIAEVDGRIRFDALNGGVRLMALAGDVQGKTTNGGLTIELEGESWDGQEMDVKTTNGGVTITVPEDYSADLETGTVNGRLDFEIPVTVRGRVDRTIRTQLGDGGPSVRAMTTNGRVRIRAGR